MPYKPIAGIYRIVNIVNKKYYIGSAVSINARFRQHRRLLSQNKHFNSHLQAAWNKYGEHSFKFEIVETVPKDLLLKAEQYWIDLCSVNNTKIGYNKRLQASTNLGIKATEDTRRKLSLAHMGHKRSAEAQAKILAAQNTPVVQIDFSGSIVAEYNSFKEAAEATGTYRTAISMCCGKKLASTGGFYWCKKEDLETFNPPDINHKFLSDKLKTKWKTNNLKPASI